MKILFIRSFNMFSESTASANRWRTITEGLSKFDLEILLVITSGYTSIEEKRTYKRDGEINSRISYRYLSGKNNYDYWPSRVNKYLLSRFNLIPVRFQLRKILKEFKPTFVLLSPGLAVFKVITGVIKPNEDRFKLAMEMNEFNDIGDLHLTNRFQKSQYSSYNYYLEKKIFPKLDICLVMTDILMKYYSQFDSLKSNISFLKVPMTVDINRFYSDQPTNKYRKPYIAYCGTSSFAKDGVDILIKSFAAISNKYPDLSLYIAAFWHKDGPKMLDLIRTSGLKDKIIYLGILSRDEIPPLIKNASILALPRPDSHQAQGGFPTKMGEYLASGNPVCVTSVGEIPDYLKDNESAFIAKPGDIDSFTAALECALRDSNNAKRVGENGRKIAESFFNMDIQAKSIYDYLTEKFEK